jgi:hypothetical protein
MQEVVLSQTTNSLHSEILFHCNPILKARQGESKPIKKDENFFKTKAGA